MDQQAPVRFLNTRWGMALGLFAYVGCLVSAVANRNWPLGALGVAGLSTWVWRVATGRPMVRSGHARTREEAIEELYPRRWRALVGTTVAVLVLTVLGVLTIVGGARRDESVPIVVGSLLVLAAGSLVVVAVRVGLVLRAHGRRAGS